MSATANRYRASSGHRAPVRSARCAVALLVVLISTVLGTLPSAAYWTASGSGGASAATSTLTPPTSVTVPASVVSDVDVSWTPGTGGVTPQGYYVTRYADAAPSPACGTSPTSLETGTTCADEGVPDGTHTYVVTAVYNSWTAASARSGAVGVANAARLGFLAQPTDTASSAPITPPVTVALQAGDGTTVALAGIPITVAVTAANNTTVPLAGTVTVATGEDGVAVFDDLAIGVEGEYTLTATSPGLDDGVSDPFVVLAPPILHDAANFSVLGGTGVTTTSSATAFTLVSGDLGVSPSTALTLDPDTVVAGDVHAGDEAAKDAQRDLFDTYTELWKKSGNAYPAANLGGQVLLPGVYSTEAALGVTGTVTLDAEGDADAIFVLRVGGALTTAATSRVVLANGARAANVFWVVTGAVTTAAGTTFVGTILAEGAITLGAGTDLTGRVLSQAAVTLHSSTIQFSLPLPTIAITGPASPTKQTSPTITGTTSVPAGRTVRVSVGDQALTATVQLGGAWSVTAAALAAGSYTVVAKVKDSSGNGAVASRTLVVEVNPAPVVLGSAGSFSVLAGTSVGNTGATNVSGDLGLDSSGTLTGFPPGTVAGQIHTEATVAQTDLAAAIADAAGRTKHTEFSGVLGGRTFHVGVHRSLAAMDLTGNVILDGEGDPDAVFIFQGDFALDTAAASTVTLVNGAQAANVFWVVTGAVTTAAPFTGTILATGAITLGADTTLVGRALSRAAVTLSSNTIRFTASVPPSMTIVGGSAAVTQEGAPTITGTTSAGTGRSVTVTVGEQSLTTTVQPDGTWSVTASELSAGTHSVVARVRDANGNGATATQTLTVEANPATVNLGSAADFSVLGGTAVGNTGELTHLAGDLGLSPTGTISGLSPAMYDGELHNGDLVAAAAQADLHAAITEVGNRALHTTVSGDLGGQTFHAGVHHSAGAIGLTGTVTLDGQGKSDAVFIFRTGAAMTTAGSSTVTLINGAQASNVFWVVGGAVTAGAATSFQGTILTPSAVTLGEGATVTGRVLSGGVVTLADNRVDAP